METLPELLERKSSDSQATPISDMWNFTNLNKHIGAAEEQFYLIEPSCFRIDCLLDSLKTQKHLGFPPPCFRIDSLLDSLKTQKHLGLSTILFSN